MHYEEWLTYLDTHQIFFSKIYFCVTNMLHTVSIVAFITTSHVLNPFLVQCHIYIPPENVREPLVFWRFLGV